MKLQLFLCVTVLICLGASLSADILNDDLGSENITAPIEGEQEGRGPFSVQIDGDYIWPARIRHSFGSESLTFATGNVEANLVCYYDSCLNEAAIVGLEYQYTFLDWNRNAFFNQQNYNNLALSLGGISERFSCWTWRGELDINFCNLANWNIQDYMNYNVLLWGRYAWLDNVGVHIGFLAETGMKIDNIYPIIGIDWICGPRWKVSLVFPVNISLVYTINNTWTTALQMRFFDQRNRTKKNEYLERAVWHYQTAGSEFEVKYTPFYWLTASAHVGINYGGRLKVSDMHYRHPNRIYIQSAPYAGGELVFNF